MSRLNGVVRFGSSMGGLREEDARIELNGLREHDAGVAMGGLREDDARVSMSGLREQDAGISLSGLREDDAAVFLSGVSGLREQDANINLLSGTKVGELTHDYTGRPIVKPIYNPVIYKEMKLKRPENMTSTSDEGSYRFHPVRIQGQPGMHGIFDFLKPMPSYEEYRGRLQNLVASWTPLKARISKLPGQQMAAVYQQIGAMDGEPDAYDTLATYLNDGPTGMTRGRSKRIDSLEAGLPAIEKLVSQLETSKPAASPTQEKDQASEALAEILKRMEAAERGSPLINYGLPIAGGLLLLGAVYAVSRSGRR